MSPWLLAAALATAPASDSLTSIPLGKGLPVLVRTGLSFAEVATLDENAGAFAATVDLRLRWQDARLRYPAEEEARGFRELKDATVEAKLQEIWAPDARFSNVVGEVTTQARGLRLFPDGSVELMQRVSGQFEAPFDVQRFPFDRQRLRVGVAVPGESQDRVTLEFRQDDLDFSRAAPGLTLSDWTVGLVDVRREPQGGWYGRSHARLFFSLEVARQAGQGVAPIFIPLFASLLIPLLAIWMNKTQNGDFQIEAFELANVLVGGLFAVIALNFTVNADHGALAASDNTVTRLFALNYATLGLSLVIDIALFRFSVVKRVFGAYAQEQTFLYLMWAVPVAALATASAIVLAAAA